MTKNVVVGGGISGLLASIILKKRFPEQDVLLIEQGDRVGGLLGSIQNEDGLEFDFGTHIPGQMQHDEIDDILFGGIDETKWHILPKLLPGNASYNGDYYRYCQLPWLGSIEQPDLGEATYQLLSADIQKAEAAEDAESFLSARYGSIFVDKFFKPVLAKLQDAPLHELHPDAYVLFGYKRIHIGPPEMMRWLKKEPKLDQILSFASYDEGLSGILHYYPNDGTGVRRWPEHLEAKAKSLGIEVMKNTGVSQLNHNSGRISSVVLNGNTEIPVNHMIWTAAIFPLIKLSGIPFESQYRARFQPMMLHHMVYDRPFPTHNTHIYVNDANFEMFRTTMYPNLISEDQKPPFKISIETLARDISNPEAMQERADRELRELGIVDGNAKLLSCMNVPVQNGFPIFTNQFVNELKRQHTVVSDSFQNITLCGKASANNFFMKPVLLEVHNLVTQLAG